MNITVYLGSTYGNDPDFKTKIIELGTWIAKNNHTLVFGGSKTGLMGELANSTLNAGGKVIGVEAQMFVDEGVHMDNLTKLYIEKDIADRRTRMIELGDAFIRFIIFVKFDNIGHFTFSIIFMSKDNNCIY